MNSRRWLGGALAAALLAATAAAGEGPIQDNSFLIEEAYNQESGVVQHISTLELDGKSSEFVTTFTEEWPYGGILHQLSYTLTVARAGGEVGLGDLALNYRYQLVGDGAAPLAIAPRFSLLLPTGDERRGLGTGAVGAQVALPVSAVLARRLVGHWNLGATFVPNSEAASGAKADTAAVSLGQGLVFLARPNLNLMLEAVWSRGQVVRDAGGTERETSFVLSPGLRFAIDRPNGLQIVPGIAVPIGVGPSSGDWSVFFYLSFEHPF
jgi:hypothetical protein